MYGYKVLKLIRKLDKIDFKFKKAKLNLHFLDNSGDRNLMASFLKLKLANKMLENADVCKLYQQPAKFGSVYMSAKKMSR